MKYTLNNILFLLRLVIEKLSELMIVEKDSQLGIDINHALKKLQEAENILDENRRRK